MLSTTPGDRFIQVTRGTMKPKASTSPTLPSQPKPGSSEPVCDKTLRKNMIPVIIRGVNETFKTWKNYQAN